MTRLFRASLVLYSNRFDMYCEWQTKEELFSKMDEYLNRDYYVLNDTEFILTYEHEYDNSETLVVDFINNQALIV